MKKTVIGFLLLWVTVSVGAQYANTLYFLENSPYRHTINPAFMPISKVYFGMSPMAYMNASIRSTIALSDVLQKKDGKIVTALYNDKTRQKFLRNLRLSGKRFSGDVNMNLNILSFGFRVKDKNYFHLNISEHFEAVGFLPYDIFRLAMDDGMDDFTGTNRFDLSRLGFKGNIYTELAIGYSRIINEQWTVGGKFKLLSGQLYMGLQVSSLDLKTSYQRWTLDGRGDLMLSGPFKESSLPAFVDRADDDAFQPADDLRAFFKPYGFGVAVDMGAVYRPFELLKTSFAITDLGFISWKRMARRYDCKLQATYIGLQGKIDMQAIWNTLGDLHKNMLSSTIADDRFTRMIRAKLNVGADLMLVNDKIDIGLYSKTDFFGKYVSEEITLGAALRPANWFHFALTYSFVGANWNCLGTGLTLMPKDGIQFMLACDYIPLKYATIDNKQKVPYKLSNIDLSLGFALVFGSYKKEKKEEAPPILQTEETTETKHRKVKNDNENPHLSQKDRNWKKKKNW